MIPDFDGNGLLPKGIHIATLAEFEGRFAKTAWRVKFFPYLLDLIRDLRRVGVTGIYVDGGYTTNKRIPSDMDICWDDTNIDYNYIKSEMPILFDLDFPRLSQQAVYKSDIFPAHFIETSSGLYFIDFFQKDKYTNLPKGIIKIEI